MKRDVGIGCTAMPLDTDFQMAKEVMKINDAVKARACAGRTPPAQMAASPNCPAPVTPSECTTAAKETTNVESVDG